MECHVWRKVGNGKLWELARKNRLHPTEAEAMMWQCLRTKFYGSKFRRQQIIGEYIVDFVCVKKGLVIEIDGEYHNTEEQRRYDEIRTQYLNSYGFTVMRFTNDEVLTATEEVEERIRNFLIKELL